MVSEYLHGGLSIGIVGGLEAEVVHTHFGEEGAHEADEVAKGEVVVGDDAFDLVEFGEMGGVDCFITEDTVDGEVFCYGRERRKELTWEYFFEIGKQLRKQKKIKKTMRELNRVGSSG